MRERFAELTAGLTRERWRVLGVLACEKKLAPSLLDKLTAGANREWLTTLQEGGLLIDAGMVHALAYTRSPHGERALGIAPEFRPLVLRQLADAEELEAVRRLARSTVGELSQSEFVTALYAGDLPALSAAAKSFGRNVLRGDEQLAAQSLLREAVCEPFDARWLERRWGDWAAPLVEQVLADALNTLESVEPAYEWLGAQLDADSSKQTRTRRFEHALLRGDTSAAPTLLGEGVTEEPFAAALAYVEGDLQQAQAALSAHLANKRATSTEHALPVSVSVLLSLLALSRDTAEGKAAAKRLLHKASAPMLIEHWPITDWPEQVNRALRSLLKRQAQPESERARSSAHQQPLAAPAWDTLLNGLAVALHERDAVTRAGWSRRLLSDGTRIMSAGYRWFARQLLALSNALASSESGPPIALPSTGRELWLCDLLEPRPEWRSTLDALTAFTKSVERTLSVVSRRVAWYVNMASGELAKPGLEEFRAGSGWTRERRVELSELYPLIDSLPPEDAAVLRSSDPSSQRLELELLDSLVGHPRVFNGARGRLPVEVVRGSPRIETRREHGHWLLQVEPARADEGVNTVVESESRLVVYRVNATALKLLSLLPHGARIPENQRHELLPLLARLAEHVEVRSAELGGRRAAAADSTPCIRISPEAGAWWLELGVRPFGADGRFFPAGLGRATITAHDGSDLVDAERNLDEEQQRLRALFAACATLRAASEREQENARRANDDVYTLSLSEEELFALLGELKDSGLRFELEWQNARPVRARGKLQLRDLHGLIRRSKGWYLLAGSVSIDHVTTIALSQLLELPFTKTGRFVRLPNGDFVELEQRLRQTLAALKAASADAPRGSAQGELAIPGARFPSLRELLRAGSGVEADAETARWFAELDRTFTSAPEPPAELRATLRAYQLDGYRWLWRFSQLELGVCLADDMGLGKTLQLLALLLTRTQGGPALVVAPTSVCNNWLEEIARFAPTLQALEYGGRNRAALLDRFRETSAPRPDVLIVSYALLQQDAAELCSLEWNTIVLDEAQFIKNAHSQRAKSAFALRARWRVALTGTPVENHLGDLWSIFHFLVPELLGSWKEFQLSYVRPIERDQDLERRAALRQLLQPFLLRRRKDEVLRELPPITTLQHDVRLSEDEALRYAYLRRQIHDKLRTPWGKRQHKLQIFSEITRLRRFCCHPRLVFPDAPLESSKLETFLELCEELRENGHRALVFSQFVDFLDLVRERLDELGVRYVYLDGSTPKELRPERVQAFQNGEAELFLISLKAGGFGLNLTRADYVIHLDPWWNPAVEAQATDRAHRIGQEQPVTVYRLVTRDTIEEQMLTLHRDKRELADAVLAGSEAINELSVEQLLELLGPP